MTPEISSSKAPRAVCSLLLPLPICIQIPTPTRNQKNKEQVEYHFTDEVQHSPRPFKKSGNKSPQGSHVFSLSE
ncbi:hypothetical protein SEES0695_20967 [Salmonella enterica subsp. enterica serovar Soerenga]|nr:hypothetical protein SEES0695_20967 [Salmonella enterica subsp. enterica serovar Soerenga str. 695]